MVADKAGERTGVGELRADERQAAERLADMGPTWRRRVAGARSSRLSEKSGGGPADAGSDDHPGSGAGAPRQDGIIGVLLVVNAILSFFEKAGRSALSLPRG